MHPSTSLIHFERASICARMSLGEKAMLTIPASMAYGHAGAGGSIPPNSDLVFEARSEWRFTRVFF